MSCNQPDPFDDLHYRSPICPPGYADQAFAITVKGSWYVSMR